MPSMPEGEIAEKERKRSPYHREERRNAQAAKNQLERHSGINQRRNGLAEFHGDVRSPRRADPEFFDVSLHDFIRQRDRFIPLPQRAPSIVASADAFRQKAINEMAFDPSAASASGASDADAPASSRLSAGS